MIRLISFDAARESISGGIASAGCESNINLSSVVPDPRRANDDRH